MPARVINILLGIWLFISTFLWRHHPDQVMNAWACGLITVALAAIAISQPVVRYLNAAVGLWIFLSAWVVPSLSRATIWTDALTGVAIFAFAMVPSSPRNESGIPPVRRGRHWVEV
jgi:hypothetical protein